MKTCLLLLLIPVVSATCFYIGSYVFPNKDSKDTIHLKTEKVNAVNESSPLPQNILEDEWSNSSKEISDSFKKEFHQAETKDVNLDLKAIKIQIRKIQFSINEIIQKQKNRIQKLSDFHEKRLEKLPIQIKKAEFEGYERGKAVTLKLLQKK